MGNASVHKVVHTYENLVVILSLAGFIGVIIIFYPRILENSHYIFIAYFILAVFNRLDPWYVNFVALLLFGFSIVLFLTKRSEIITKVTLYAFYFLIVGIGLEIVDFVMKTVNTRNQTQVNIESLIDSEFPKKNKHDSSMKKEETRVIAIASGKGGVGKTTITANLGVALSRLGKTVTTVEMDIAMPNLEVIMGIKQPPVGLIDVVKGDLDIRQVTYLGVENVKVIPSGQILDGFTEDNIKKIRRALSNIVDTDFIILDMSPGREGIKVLKSGYEMIIVANLDKASVLDALNLKIIAQDAGIKLVGVVVNKIGAYPREMAIKDIENALELPILGRIPQDDKVAICYDEEVPFKVKHPDIIPSKEIRRLAEILVNQGNENMS